MKTKILMLSLLASVAFVNTNAKSSWWVCAEPQNAPLTAVQYGALDYVKIGGVGNAGETGSNTNWVDYPTWDDDVIQKAKGMTDAGSPTLECARNEADAGQIVMNLAGAIGNNNYYAFKEQRADGTIRYHRGGVSGPVYPGGQNEDIDLAVYTMAMVQAVTVVAPSGGSTGGNAPEMTVAPAITGTAKVGTELTASAGTFTGDAPLQRVYKWFAGGVAIAGAGTSKYTPTTANLGKVITVQVTAINQHGQATAMSEPTTAVVA